MLKIKLLVLTLVLAVIMAGGVRGLEAAVTFYTDKAAWSAAVGGEFMEETFQDNMLHDPE